MIAAAVPNSGAPANYSRSLRYCRVKFSRFRRCLIPSIATYINERLIPAPPNVGSQARCATPRATPMGSKTARTPIQASLVQIPRQMRLRVSSSGAIAGSAPDTRMFFASDLWMMIINIGDIAAQVRPPRAHSRSDSMPQLTPIHKSATGPKITASAMIFRNMLLFATVPRSLQAYSFSLADNRRCSQFPLRSSSRRLCLELALSLSRN